MNNEIREKIAKQLNLKIEEVKPEVRIVEDLGYDSLDTVEMLIGLEEEFNISIPDEEAMNLKTLGDVASYLENL